MDYTHRRRRRPHCCGRERARAAQPQPPLPRQGRGRLGTALQRARGRSAHRRWVSTAGHAACALALHLGRSGTGAPAPESGMNTINRFAVVMAGPDRVLVTRDFKVLNAEEAMNLPAWLAAVAGI